MHSSAPIDPRGPAPGPNVRVSAAHTAESVYRDHAPRITNVARRMLRNEADAEDVTQEVLLQVVRKLDTFRGDADLTTWLHRVTVNAALIHLRKRPQRLGGQPVVSLRQLRDEGHAAVGTPVAARTPERLAQDAEQRRLIELAIARLPERYRVAFLLANVEGLSHREIAVHLGLTAAAVKTRMHRARLLLRDDLAAYDPTLAGTTTA
jgi:RNA polymerase sigma-70 factor (ECF subfamily)